MKGLKVAIVFSFLLAAAALAASGYLFLQLQSEQALRDEIESEKVQLEDRSSFLESELAQSQEEIERLKKELQDSSGQRDSLKKELERARSEASELKQKLEQIESERRALTERMNQSEVAERAIVQEAVKLPAVALPAPPPAKAPAAVVPLKKAPTSREPEKAVEKPKPEEKKAVVVDERPDQVLSVNRKFNFVVVNVGLRDHVKIGDSLRVEQGGKLVGRIQVEKLYENFSACTILEEVKNAQIREGDLVRIG